MLTSIKTFSYFYNVIKAFFFRVITTQDCLVTSSPNNKILDWSKLKAFTDILIKKYDSEIDINFGRYRKHCGKRRKSWLPAFSPLDITGMRLWPKGKKSENGSPMWGLPF